MDRATEDRVGRVHKQMLAEFDMEPVSSALIERMQVRAQQLGAKEGVTITSILVGEADPSQISYNVLLPG